METAPNANELLARKRARVQWNMMSEDRRKAIRVDIDRGSGQAQRGEFVDPDEMFEGLREREQALLNDALDR